CCRTSSENSAGQGEMTLDIGQHPRESVARTRFDAYVPRSHGKAEHDQCIRSFVCQQHRQVAIDRVVAHFENMSPAADVRKAWMAAAGEFLRQYFSRIKGRARKRAKTGEKDGKRHSKIPDLHGAARMVICQARLQSLPP